MNYVKLTKISSSHSNLRTNEVLGNVFELPKIGEPFHIVSQSLTEKNLTRHVTTSRVTSIKQINDQKIEFSTQNSLYEIEIL